MGLVGLSTKRVVILSSAKLKAVCYGLGYFRSPLVSLFWAVIFVVDVKIVEIVLG